MRRTILSCLSKARPRPRPANKACPSCSRPYTLPTRTGSSTSTNRRFTTSASRKAESIIPQTHYDFFPESISGVPPHGPFVLDLKALRKEFLQLQASAHPDRHPSADKSRAEALSARINEAYKTLQDPLRRAQYLLSLRGIDVAEDETMKIEDQGLLMAVMEAREEIEEAQTEGDLEGLRRRNQEELEASLDVLDRAFEKDDIELAKTEAVKLRYLTNIKESISNWEPGKPVVLIH